MWALRMQPLVIVLFVLPAYAGPPFQTDDPVPVALGHYELYVASIGTHVKGDTAGGTPNVELTYGLRSAESSLSTTRKGGRASATAIRN
jgi:hypothetical protein